MSPFNWRKTQPQPSSLIAVSLFYGESSSFAHVKWVKTLCLTLALCVCSISAFGESTMVDTKQAKTYSFDIPILRADVALIEFAEQAGRTLLFSFDETKLKTGNRLNGQYEIIEALDILLASTGLYISMGNEGQISIASKVELEKGKTVNISKRNSVWGVLASLFVGSALEAQEIVETSAQSGRVLEEIIITSQKKSESLLDAAIDVSAFSADDLGNYGIDDISGIALAVPGLTFQNTGIWAQIYLRGVGTRVSQAGLDTGVAMYVDDRYVGRQSGLMFDMADVERVEVLKGPQGVLFGRNATGGAVRVISKEVSDELEGEFSLGFGDYGYEQSRAVLNVPVSDDFGIRASVQTRERDGFKENIVPGGRDYDDLDSLITRVKAQWDITDNTSLKLSHLYGYSKDLSNSGAVSADTGNSRGLSLGGITTTKRDEIASSPTGPTTSGEPAQHMHSTALRIESAFDGFDVAAYVNTSANFERKFGDYDATSVDDIEVASVKNVSDELGGGIEFTSNNDGPLSWVAGINYFEMELDYDYDLRLGTIPGRANSTGHQTYNLDTYGIFGSLDYALSDRWVVTVGGRYTHEEKEVYLRESSLDYADYERTTLAAALMPNRDSDEWNEFTPRVTMTYNLDNGIAYATYASGFKSGGFNYPNRRGGKSLDPETLDMIELGYKVELSESLRLTSSFFIYDYKNLQVTRAASGGGTVTTENATDSEVMGLDFDVTWAASDTLLLRMAGEWLDTEYKDYTTAARVANTILTGDPDAIGYGYDYFNAKGSQMLRAPDLSLFLTAQYDAGPLSLNLSYAWKDDYMFDFVRNPASESLRQKATGVFNGRASYDLGSGLTLGLWGKNLTDEVYLNDSVIGGTNQRINYAHPRTYGVDLTYDF
jgi:iron complex outermembrane receptor protein